MRHIIEHAAGLGMTMSGVLGNNDRQTGEFFRLLSHLPHGQHVVEGVFELRIAGKTIAAYHGHHKPTLMRVLGNFEYDAVFTGHSHKPRDERLENGVHVINPGSTAFAVPRRKDWQPSFAIYDTSTGCAEIVFY
jgi:predicted phosphodiesterase